MSIQVNGYSAPTTTKTAASSTSGNGLTINDFMKLLSAQLANQDPMNPTNETDFIAQMAQFTSLQAMQTLTEITYAQYGASMIGKNVCVSSYDNAGNLTSDKGVVDNVVFSSGNCIITVNDKKYDISAITEVVLAFKE